jgi:hypothetical protein
MKRPPNDDRPVIMSIHCSKEEYNKISELQKGTICRSLSEYARKMMLGQPVAVIFRNASLDAMIDMINETRNQLERLIEHRSLSVGDKAELKSLILELQLIFNTIGSQCIT